MKASNFLDAQKAFILKQGDDGTPVAEICRKAGISQATYFNWRKKVRRAAAGRDASSEGFGRREQPLEADRCRPDAGSRNAAGRHPPKALRPARKRKLIDGMLVDWGISIRRACKVLTFDTSSYQYKSRRTGQAPLERRIKEICETRVRYGYRRVHVHLRRDGWTINMKKTRRIYSELGLQLRNKRPKRRVKAKLRDDRQAAVGPNDVWAMDFVHDQLATGRKLRILTVVDTHSRYCPATDARFTYRGEDLVQTLESISKGTGYPRTIRVDNGSEFISRDLDLWAYANNVTLDFSRPGKPTDNGFIEAFNSKLRAECLNAHWFLTLADSREKLETWRRYYNEDRPHSAIGYNVPIAIHNPGGETGPSS
ncbi:IS3 family transposase [Agrobacterium rosae]|uniref:IS3 family transposase n=1 Tax=Agrobacterium rosae TaxID=1972867 RepID=A0AAW9FL08_9HYPH|nr:IS3 family transposase [Agrobacterium rosae]MDX8305836.1 IS3 family transposase [Agrobacterium rosae]